MRASSSTRSVAQACHARSPCTGCAPGASPMPSSRTSSQMRSASTSRPRTVPTGIQRSARPAAACSEPAEPQRRRCHRECGEERDGRQGRDEQGDGPVAEQPHRLVLRPLGPRPTGRRTPTGRRPGPQLARGHLAEHGRPGRDLGAVSDDGARRERAARTDAGVGPDRHGAHVQDVAVDPVAAEVDLGLDRAAVAEAEVPRDRGDRVQIDMAADARAQQPRVQAHEWGAGEVGRAELLREALREPDTHVHGSAARVRADARRPPGSGARRAP